LCAAGRADAKIGHGRLLHHHHHGVAPQSFLTQQILPALPNLAAQILPGLLQGAANQDTRIYLPATVADNLTKADSNLSDARSILDGLTKKNTGTPPDLVLQPVLQNLSDEALANEIARRRKALEDKKKKDK